MRIVDVLVHRLVLRNRRLLDRGDWVGRPFEKRLEEGRRVVKRRERLRKEVELVEDGERLVDILHRKAREFPEGRLILETRADSVHGGVGRFDELRGAD